MSMERMMPSPDTMGKETISTMAEKILNTRTPLDFSEKLRIGDGSYVARYIPELKTWGRRDLYLLSEAVETLRNQRADEAGRRNKELIVQQETESAARNAFLDSEHRAKRNISDGEIDERAKEVARNLVAMTGDEYAKSLRNYFSTGNHPNYPGYSGEDLRALANAVDKYSETTTVREYSPEEE